MGSSDQVIKKHLNAVAKQVVGPPTRTRPDEPNMPLETSPGSWTDTTPSSWQFSLKDLLAALYNGITSLRLYIERWLVSLGMSKNVARILILNLTLSAETIFEFAYWVIRPQTTNLPRELFLNLLGSILDAISPTGRSAIDDAAWDTFYYFEHRGVFFFGDIVAAIQRGWTINQIIEWLQFLISKGNDYYYNWPDTPEQAQEEMDLYKD